MQTLNLPKTELTTVIRRGRPAVFDPLRKRYVALTPEEWVRQHFVQFLIKHKGYPTTVIGNEVPIELFGTRKRCDTVVYDSEARPLMIIEYKAPEVEITERVFQQIGRYNIRLHVPWLIVSNGLQHYCCHINYENGTYQYLPDIPEYEVALAREVKSEKYGESSRR